jgi:hypothetical protein
VSLRLLRFAPAAAMWVAALASAPAAAEVEKIMQVCDGNKLCAFFRASFVPPDGWIEDKESTRKMGAVIFVPRGQTFHSAGAIIYATARFNRDKKPITDFIEQDQARWREKAKDVKITGLPQVARANGNEAFRHFQFEAPSMKSQPFERVATVADSDKDGNAFVVGLVLSAKSEKALSAAEPAYLAMLKAY